MTVIRIRDASLFVDPIDGESPEVCLAKLGLADLIERACASGARFPAASALRGWLAEHAAEERVAVLVGRSDLELGGLVILTAFTDALARFPWCAIFYAPGDRDLRLLLIRAAVDWCRSLGYERVAAMNQSDMPDERWMAAFKTAGEIVPLGTYVEVIL